MINVQLDVVAPGESLGDGTAVWSGVLPELPAGGDTLEIRGKQLEGEVDNYRVTGAAHWMLSARLLTERQSASVIVYVETWDPDSDPEG